MRSRGIRYCLAFLLLAGCASSNPKYNSPALKRKTDVDDLIHAAIRHAVVVERDIPDYGLIRNKRCFVLQNVRGPFLEWSADPPEPLDSISFGYAPQFEHVRIVLASPSEITEFAEGSGDFLYLVIGTIEIAADSARIDIGLNWAQSNQSRSRIAHLSGGGYRLAFRKRNDEWVFDRVISGWQS